MQRFFSLKNMTRCDGYEQVLWMTNLYVFSVLIKFNEQHEIEMWIMNYSWIIGAFIIIFYLH
jgi:hypothetical protein